MQLRTWQREALDTITAGAKADYLIEATPGAGKTVFALTLAQQRLAEGAAQRVVVVVPSDSLRQQWADAGDRAGVRLMPVKENSDYDKRGYDGCVVTYQQLAAGAGAGLLRETMVRPTLVLLDEVHHAGDGRAWGNKLRHAVENAVLRVSLTGTPWRSDEKSPIPFVDYHPETRMVQLDYSYGYGSAVGDGVCRRMEFLAYDGEARWHDLSENVDVSATLGADLPRDKEAATLDTVFDPNHEWMPTLLQEAHDALREMRRNTADAGGLVVARDRAHADAYAQILTRITGERPAVAHGSQQDPKKIIDDFRDSDQAWIVAVKMVSEGVDIPRLAVGVYATNTGTPLFFRQVVGRFVRTRPNEELNAQLFIPAVPRLMELGRTIEDELRHQIELEKQAVEREQNGHSGSPGQPMLPLRTPIGASEAELFGSILAGQEASPAEVDQYRALAISLGIPGNWAASLLPVVREKNNRDLAAPAAPLIPVPTPEHAPTVDPAQRTPRHRLEKVLRGELETLVRKLGNTIAEDSNRRTSRDKAIRSVSKDLRQTFGARASMTVEELEEATKLIEWRISQREEARAARA
jgi:superfamily II DNA or RNA helicase